MTIVNPKTMKRTGRPKSGKEKLTREKILTTALALVDKESVEALTMRRLATTLHVDPMALYHYFESKEGILSALAALVFGEFQVTQTKSRTWQEQVRAFAVAYRNLTQKHPNLVRHLVTDMNVATAAALPANEVLYSALQRGGLSPIQIVNAADLLVDFLNGLALSELSSSDPIVTSRYTYYSEHAENFADYPTMHAVLASLDKTDQKSSFDAQLGIILKALESLAQ